MENFVPDFEDLSLDEMEAIQGAGDVQAETTPLCAAFTAGAAIGTLFSAKFC